MLCIWLYGCSDRWLCDYPKSRRTRQLASKVFNNALREHIEFGSTRVIDEWQYRNGDISDRALNCGGICAQCRRRPGFGSDWRRPRAIDRQKQLQNSVDQDGRNSSSRIGRPLNRPELFRNPRVLLSCSVNDDGPPRSSLWSNHTSMPAARNVAQWCCAASESSAA